MVTDSDQTISLTEFAVIKLFLIFEIKFEILFRVLQSNLKSKTIEGEEVELFFLHFNFFCCFSLRKENSLNPCCLRILLKFKKKKRRTKNSKLAFLHSIGILDFAFFVIHLNW